MTKFGLRRPPGPLANATRNLEFETGQLKRLCVRIGVEFLTDPANAQEMWAEIGERLALEQPEFHRPKSRGRPKKMESKEVELAERVEEEKRNGVNNITDALVSLENKGHVEPRDPQTRKSQASRGAKKLESLRFHGAGEDDWTIFDIFRSDLRKNRPK